MYDQPYREELEESSAFSDGRSSRPLPAGTIPQQQVVYDPHLLEGMVNNELATELPMPLTRPLLNRGQQLYTVYCAPCHGATGMDNGMVVQRGFLPPPTYHNARLRTLPIGHIFRVMTYGFGTMYSYADRIKPEERWAVAAYVRVLQYSQYAPLDAVPDAARTQLEAQS